MTAQNTPNNLEAATKALKSLGITCTNVQGESTVPLLTPADIPALEQEARRIK